MNRFQKIGFIGLGLIGGSIAKAIKYHHPECEIHAYDLQFLDKEHAASDQVISKFHQTIDDELLNCDCLFLCAPVLKNRENVQAIITKLSKNCLLTDVGSVKGDIHECLREQHFTGYFIGGHPMTGSEKSGYYHSSHLLLENAYYILTPNENVPDDYVCAFSDFITSLGSISVLLDVDFHDEAVAVISHLPHIIASSLIHFLKNHDHDNQIMKQLAAGGFKDITRIASSNVSMWQDICLTNNEKISRMLLDYIHELQKIYEMLTKKDRDLLGAFFSGAKDYRDSMSDSKRGALPKEYALYVDVFDETGCISTIAALLAENQINIKNIGIIHNREFEEGVLRIEFYEATSLKHAVALLNKRGYHVTERK